MIEDAPVACPACTPSSRCCACRSSCRRPSRQGPRCQSGSTSRGSSMSGRSGSWRGDRSASRASGALGAELAKLAEAGQLAELFQQAIDQRMNILVSGGTSSGKTTVARALLSLTNRAERLVTIEDARELHLPHENSVALIAERTEVPERTPAKLLIAALRMRPDRLILGEMRGEEALAFLEAINTGHPGSISTLHADSPVLALERLALMVMQAGTRQTRRDVLDYATRTIDVIVQVGRRGGMRGVIEVIFPTARGISAGIQFGFIRSKPN